ncbi:alanine dehydrogenase [Candidatus Synechococcus calcipolaris G9]|uniref:Alanine dehydrogenase n=1 Tax=Candidatus Synechococcus calcipolaris G9 TaxID=1497997 RepID=A0ABT6F001_9SYNE|nr:alanine dehydrogenase [Candidatus Synechococcus calcipolaris]MDG2991108.1 alanine dehydrogenase [Candidatus Synechococcus calcipolaris G9]
MDIGLPKEIKDQEFRVGLTPGVVQTLTEKGHRVYVETDAGVGSGFPDHEYSQAGAILVPTAKDAWQQELIIKVKEPLPSEYEYLKQDQLLFTYLHLAASQDLTQALMESGVTAIAYETVEQLSQGQVSFPLLTPMSMIAGRLAVQFGARFLERSQGGRGVLLSGIPGVKPAQVVILGGGVVGTEAARIAVGMGAQVKILDINVDRLIYLETLFGSRIEYLYSTSHQIAQVIPGADLVIGAVLVPGQRPPCLVPADLVKQMHPGSVIVDVAVDQGGCIETLRPTSHSQPIYCEYGVIHYGVPNMPGAVPWTATQALTNSTLPYILRLANSGIQAFDRDPGLGRGLNVQGGRLMHPAVKQVFPELN